MIKEERLAEEYAENLIKHKMSVHDVFDKVKAKEEIMETFLTGLKEGSQLDKVWQDYDPSEDCYEDTHEGKWVERKDKHQWHKQDVNDIYDAFNDWSVHFYLCRMKDGSLNIAMGSAGEDCNGGVSRNIYFEISDEKYYVDDIEKWIEISKEIE